MKNTDKKEINISTFVDGDAQDIASSDRTQVSPAVIKRLPRYFRYLRELIRMGKCRVSSSELSRMMNVTASQIRQDLNCFGGFGQQGYGYNVNYLYKKICEILGVDREFTAALIGVGNLGKALVRSPMFEKRGVNVLALLDVSDKVVGSKLEGLTVHHMDELERIFERYSIDIAILTLPKENAVEIAERLEKTGIGGIWNFTGKELSLSNKSIEIENVHIGDSLMTLCYKIARKKTTGDSSDNEKE